jgi:NAD(P)H-hydrate epimerase
MAAEAALSCGAGLVSVATRAEHVSAVLARTPEVMVHAVANRHELDNLLAGMSVVVIGPGLGQSPWSEQLLQVVLERDQPLVVDADALNILVTKQWLGRLAARTAPVVVTPHPGEAARMLGQTTAQVQGDRLAASRALQALIDGVVVLKGAGSLVSSNRGVGLSDFGNAGMASGGMGDVLSGVLGALLAQIPDAVFATELGVCLHGDAADLAAAKFGLRGLRATQLMPYLQERLGG